MSLSTINASSLSYLLKKNQQVKYLVHNIIDKLGTKYNFDSNDAWQDLGLDQLFCNSSGIAKRSPEKKLIPYRTEWTVFDEDLGLAGSIDLCFIKPDGTIAIYDWKRSKEIKQSSSFYVKYSKNPVLSHIPDLNYWHYSLQLNIYKQILERKYGKTVSEMCLVCLHPNHKNYQRISVVDMSTEVNELFGLGQSLKFSKV